MNRTLLERVRCILFYSGLPKTFWAEAMTTAAYLINRLPSVPIGFKTSMEMWTRRMPNFDKLRVFRCAVFAHTKQEKFDSRAIKGVFLGYPDGVKG